MDHQVLPITVVSMEYGPSSVSLRFDTAAPTHSGDFSVAGWRVENEQHTAGALDTKAVNSSHESFVRFDYNFEVSREVRYYVWRAKLRRHVFW